MSDISKYPVVGSIKLSDKMLGTSVGGVNPENGTYNFLLSQLLDIISSNLTALGTVISGVQEYADNTAAKAAGLTPGKLYRTGDVLKIVH